VPVVAPSVGVMQQLRGWGAAWVSSDASPQSMAATVCEAAAQISGGTQHVKEHFLISTCADRFDVAFEKARD
jgi:hypothetical protein